MSHHITFVASALGAAVVMVAVVIIAPVVTGPRNPFAGGALAADRPTSPLSAQSQQAAAAADGDISFEEYQQGFKDFVDCAAGAGWLPDGPITLTRRQVYEYRFYTASVVPDASPEQRSKLEAGLNECRSLHFDQVQWGWELKMTMSDTERQTARDFLGACMRGQDVTVVEHPGSQDLQNFIRVTDGFDVVANKVFRTCLKETQARFDLRRFEVP